MSGLMEKSVRLKEVWEREVELAEAMRIGSLALAIKDYASWRDPHITRVNGEISLSGGWLH